MSLRFHEIAEANHRILNPFTEDKLMLLGQVCRLKPGMKQLDLACGKAEMLCQWAQRYGINGVGVGISDVFLAAARARAAELGVASQITFVQEDAGKYQGDAQSFDVVSCIGATWIGNGLVGTLALMKPALKPGGLLLVGEPYWIDPPPPEAYEALGVSKDGYTSLNGTFERFEQARVELVEMVLANQDSWDRYAASQWMTLSDWLRDNPNDPDALAIRKWLNENRSAYLQYGRRYLGWGVFVLRAA